MPSVERFLVPPPVVIPDGATATEIERLRFPDAPQRRAFVAWWETRYSDDQPRDEHGRWSSGGGDATSAVIEGAVGGGASIDPTTGSEPKTGYMVAIDGHSSITPDERFFGSEGPQVIDEWLAKNADTLSEPGMHIGVWHDTEHGEVVLDPSQNVGDRAEAVRLGVERNQQSIWDVANATEILTGGTGGRSSQKATSNGQTGEAGIRHDTRRAQSVRGGTAQADRGSRETEVAFVPWWESRGRRGRAHKRESAPAPPNYRPATDPSECCGTCRMYGPAGLCWGYGNTPVARDHVCDSWEIARERIGR